MSSVQEIERAAEQLPAEDFAKLSAWVARRQDALGRQQPALSARPCRDHSAFLNSYAPEDEGLYDDGASR
jgi:hypothetical protein